MILSQNRLFLLIYAKIWAYDKILSSKLIILSYETKFWTIFSAIRKFGSAIISKTYFGQKRVKTDIFAQIWA